MNRNWSNQREIPLSKPKWGITKITNRQKTMRTNGLPSGQLFPKDGRSATHTKSITNKHKVKHNRNSYNLKIFIFQVLKLEFLTFDVEYHSTCFYDRLSIADGDNFTEASTNIMLCGNNSKDSFLSSESSLTLTFISDHVVQKTGLTAKISGWSTVSCIFLYLCCIVDYKLVFCLIN